MFPKPILVIIPGQVEIYMYGLMIALGILACFGVLFYFSKKRELKKELVDFIFMAGAISIAVGFLFAALFQATYNYIENPSAGFKFGGITFIGGLIGGVIAFIVSYFIFGKKYGKLWDITEIAPCCILIAHGFGRLGCFFAGCCYGKITDSSLGMVFGPHVEGGQAVYPTNLYEAIFLFLMFGVVTYLYLTKKSKHNLAIYLISYGIFRFLIEYMRGDHRGELVTGISPSQFWSILMVVAGVGLILFHYYVRPKLAEKKAKTKA